MSSRCFSPFSEDEFESKLQALNAALGSPLTSVFEWTTARKQHEDLFGDIIKTGDAYLKRERNSLGWGQELKVSTQSMVSIFLVMNLPGSPLDDFLEKIRDRPMAILARYADMGAIPPDSTADEQGQTKPVEDTESS